MSHSKHWPTGTTSVYLRGEQTAYLKQTQDVAWAADDTVSMGDIVRHLIGREMRFSSPAALAEEVVKAKHKTRMAKAEQSAVKRKNRTR